MLNSGNPQTHISHSIQYAQNCSATQVHSWQMESCISPWDLLKDRCLPLSMVLSWVWTHFLINHTHTLTLLMPSSVLPGYKYLTYGFIWVFSNGLWQLKIEIVFSRSQFLNFQSLNLFQHVSKFHSERKIAQWQKSLPRLALNTAAKAPEHARQMGVGHSKHYWMKPALFPSGLNLWAQLLQLKSTFIGQ